MQKLLLISLLSLLLLLFGGCSQSKEVILNESVPINITSPLDYHNKYVLTANPSWEEVHLGNSFMLSSKFTLSTNQNLSFVGCTPSSTHINFINLNLIASNGNIEVLFSENVTYSGGTAINGTNMNRELKIPNTLNLISGVTLLTTQKEIFRDATIGTSNNKLSSTLSIDLPIILNSNTCYAFTIINLDSNNNQIWSNLFWLEE